MSNLSQFTGRFFAELELREDKENGHSYRSYLAAAAQAFLEDETPENAFAVYRSFFDSYRITLGEGKDPFLDLVDLLRNYENTAATLIDKQRDHFIHSVNVFLTGLAIWERNPRFRAAFDAAIPEKGFEAALETRYEEFFFRWGLAALFHDVGYPVEIVGHQINRFIRMIADADGDEVTVRAQIRYENFAELNHIREIVPKRSFTKAYYDAYESCCYVDLLTPLDLIAHRIHRCFATDLEQTKDALDRFVDDMAASGFIDHGYYSALIVLKWYGYALQLAEGDPRRFYWPVVDSATAIFLHNYYRNVLLKPPFALGPMRAADDPIAFLLILCDELQEWHREAHGILTRRFTLADTVNLSLREDYLAATYVTRRGSLPDDFCAEKKALLRKVLAVEEIFPLGLDVDAESLEALDALRPQLERFSPRPLPEELELLAIAIHARYNEKQLADHPDRPLEYPDFSALPDDLKYSNLRQAQSIYDKLELIGCTLRPKGRRGAITVFSDEQVELMAAFEHEQWMRERLSRGWRKGRRSADDKLSPYLLPYEELPEEIREYDRDAVRSIPVLAEQIGMAVYEKS